MNRGRKTAMRGDEPEAKALARARAEKVRLVKLVGEERYLATSRGVEPGAYYELRVNRLQGIHCSCAGFGYRSLCKHAAALRARLERERRRGRKAESKGSGSVEGVNGAGTV